MKLSVIIPSYKDPYLQKTIDSLLHRPGLGSQIEVIVVLDGYWPETPLKDNPRLKIVHLGKNSGMREAINAGVRVARGEYIMRTDEHCLFADGYAKTMTDDCQDNWIMTPIRYYLDPVKWQVMKREPVVYEKLGIQSVGGKKKFCGLSWKERERERKDILVDETMAMQGSCWLMKKSWWDKTIKKLDSEHYGTHYQDSHEMIFKTWQAGGKLMVNKKTWFAHKYYKFPRSHNYGSQTGDPRIQYCYDTYKDYYRKEIRPKWKI